MKRSLIFFLSFILVFVFFTTDVLAEVRVIFPNNGDILALGRTYEIEWTSTLPNANFERAFLFRTSDREATPLRIWIRTQVTWVAEGRGRASFAIPMTFADERDYKIRVEYLGEFDENEGNFTITGSEPVVITWPRGGEELYKTRVVRIRWDSPDPVTDTLEILLHGDLRGTKRIGRAAPGTTSFEWTICSETFLLPPREVSVAELAAQRGKKKRYNISMRNARRTINAKSEGFDIYSPTIKVVEPNGGEVYFWGAPFTIRWNSDHIDGPVFIELYFGDVLHETIAKSTGDWRTFRYTYCEDDRPPLGSECSIGNKFKIRIGSARCAHIFDESDDYFEFQKR